MKASFVDLRKHSREILKVLDRGERVTLLYRGKPKAVIVPLEEKAGGALAPAHPAVGMWADREDMKDPAAYVRRIRKGRFGGH